mmetsp:Transcript_93122/g.221507  ORF Transcript_93122/g.221507 Transcript_93122/m.221507 type:complete len:249 (+) Transcript_93122:260-1006(+)
MPGDAVVRNEACFPAGLAGPPRVACPIAAECDVDHDLLRVCNVHAALWVEWHEGHAPLRRPLVRRGRIVLEIRRDLRLGDVKGGDAAGVPHSHQHPRVLAIPLAIFPHLGREAAQGVAAVVGEAAGDHLVGDVRHLLDAVQHLRDIQTAVLIRVERDFGRLVIGELQYVQLPTVGPRPVAVQQPEGRPHPGAIRHVLVLQSHDKAHIRAPRLWRVQHQGTTLEGMHLLPHADDGPRRARMRHGLPLCL